MKNHPRLHHYLSRFYLEGFCNPSAKKREGKSVIWVYEKEKLIRRSTPEKEARERDFYAVDRNGQKDFRAEEWLGTVEQNVAPIFVRLQDVRYVLSPEEREWIALFVGTMSTRTPSGRALMDNRIGPAVVRLMKEAAKDASEFAALCRKIDLLADGEVDLEEVRNDFLTDRASEICERPDFKVASVIEVGRMEAEVLLGFDWQIVYSSGSEFFLTSDHPVVAALWEEGKGRAQFHVGVAVSGADIGFPLTRTMWLRIKKGIQPGPCRIPDRGVRLINKSTILSAYRRAYAAERSAKLQELFDRRGGEASIESFQPTWDGKPI